MLKSRFDVPNIIIDPSNLLIKAKVFFIILWKRLFEVRPWRMAANYSFLSLLLVGPLCVLLFACIESFTIFKGIVNYFVSKNILHYFSEFSIKILSIYYNQY